MKKTSLMIAKKYASALAELSLDNSTLDNLALLKQIFVDNPDFQRILSNPSIKSSLKKQIFEDLFAPYFSRDLISLLCLLLDKRRVDLIPLLHTAYLEIFFAKSNISFAELYSVEQVDTDLVAQISQKLEQVLNKSVELVNHIDPSLIAGYKLKVENKVLDLSIRTKMRQIQDLLVR